jgi:trehalose 6-phosphate phosphatase
MSARRRRTRNEALPHPDPSWAFFIDIDGTLVEFADSPAGIRFGQELVHLLERLSRATGGAVALISGRSIAQMDRLFDGFRPAAAGQHGTERRDAAGRISRHELPLDRLVPVRARLAEAEARHPGLLLEDKGLSLALHYRRAPRLGGYAHRLLRGVQRQLGPEYGVQRGKRVVELKPAGRHKGMAVLEFMGEPPFHGRIPVFLGDDDSDEVAFAVVNELGGYSVKVGRGSTLAHWRLRGVQEVRAWLSHQMPARAPARAAAAAR